jgi:hypothetical protein
VHHLDARARDACDLPVVDLNMSIEGGRHFES